MQTHSRRPWKRYCPPNGTPAPSPLTGAGAGALSRGSCSISSSPSRQHGTTPRRGSSLSAATPRPGCLAAEDLLRLNALRRVARVHHKLRLLHDVLVVVVGVVG